MPLARTRCFLLQIGIFLNLYCSSISFIWALQTRQNLISSQQPKDRFSLIESWNEQAAYFKPRSTFNMISIQNNVTIRIFKFFFIRENWSRSCREWRDDAASNTNWEFVKASHMSTVWRGSHFAEVIHTVSRHGGRKHFDNFGRIYFQLKLENSKRSDTLGTESSCSWPWPENPHSVWKTKAQLKSWIVGSLNNELRLFESIGPYS